MHSRHIYKWWWLAGLVILLLMMAAFPLAAQQNPPGFATNTPVPPPLAFATNTPQPLLNPVIQVPSAPLERYALRRWDEASLVNILLEQVRRLQPGETERALVIRLLQLELERRFPGAPRHAEQRESLLRAMLAAPRGSVDMRAVIRPFITGQLNTEHPTLDSTSTLTAAGFALTIMPMNLDGVEPLDALVHIIYPADAATSDDVLYEDYVPAQQNGATYVLAPGTAAIPAAPFSTHARITLERLGDVNQDHVEEFALVVDDSGSVNHELLIFGWRSGAVVNLIQPGQHIQFGTITDWPRDAGSLTVHEYTVESLEWNCLGTRTVNWSWTFNFFRQPAELPEFGFENSVGCRLYQAEPLFEMPVTDAVSTIEGIIQSATPDDAAAVDRAAMTVAMLRVMEGRADLALGQIERLASSAQPGSWLAAQTTAFQTVAAQPNTTPLVICAALEHATQYGVCHADDVLARQFKDDPLRRDLSIRDQLEIRGLLVMDTVTLSNVGQFDRQAVRLNLAGYDYWWAFAPLSREFYTAEQIDPPPAFLLPEQAPVTLAPPTGAFLMLLDANNPSAVLNQIENLLRDNPGIPLDSSARFLQALSYDLVSNRDNARPAYFALWSDDPASIWGQLAAAHLEKR